MSIIAAYSMADMEMATFGRGKDKKKRKSRGALIAGGVAAGAVGAGAAARYGGAEASRAIARKRATGLSTKANEAEQAYKKAQGAALDGVDDGGKAFAARNKAYGAASKNAKVMRSGGAKGQLKRDVNALRGIKLGKKRTVGSALDVIGGSLKQVGQATKGGFRKGKLGETGAKRALGGVKGAVRGAWSAGKTGKGAVIGAGLLGAGALAGAGYGAYKLANRKKKKG